MSRTTTVMIKCKQCGAIVEAQTEQKMYCEKCIKERHSQKQKEYYDNNFRGYKKNNKNIYANVFKRKDVNLTLRQRVAEATKQHISYGEYMMRRQENECN